MGMSTGHALASAVLAELGEESSARSVSVGERSEVAGLTGVCGGESRKLIKSKLVERWTDDSVADCSWRLARGEEGTGSPMSTQSNLAESPRVQRERGSGRMMFAASQ